jgi:Helix-turn-helix domain
MQDFVYNEAVFASDLSPSQRLLLIVIRKHAHDGECYASLPTLTKETGLSRDTIIRETKKLVTFGWLVKTQEGKGSKSRMSNAYRTALPTSGTMQLVETDSALTSCTMQLDQLHHATSTSCTMQQQVLTSSSSLHVSTSASQTDDLRSEAPSGHKRTRFLVSPDGSIRIGEGVRKKTSEVEVKAYSPDEINLAEVTFPAPQLVAAPSAEALHAAERVRASRAH